MRRLPHLREGRSQPRRPEPVRHCRTGPRQRGRLQLFRRHEGQGGKWTYDDLNKFIANPKGFVPGTAMGFAGIPKDSERADVIAYLRTLADSPVPLPTASK